MALVMFHRFLDVFNLSEMKYIGMKREEIVEKAN